MLRAPFLTIRPKPSHIESPRRRNRSPPRVSLAPTLALGAEAFTLRLVRWATSVDLFIRYVFLAHFSFSSHAFFLLYCTDSTQAS